MADLAALPWSQPSRVDLVALARQAGVRRKRVLLRPIEASRGAEKSYEAALLALIRQAADHVRSDILPAVIAEQRLSLGDAAAADAIGDRFREIMAGFRALLAKLTGIAEGMAGRIFKAEADRHTDRFAASVKAAIGIDMSAVLSASDIADPLSIRTAENARLIRSLAEDVASRVERAVLQNYRDGGTAKQLAKTLTGEFGFPQRRAKLIARDQTAKLASDLNEIRQRNAGIEKYDWSTSKDEPVRPTHRANEGKTFRWDTPPPVTGHPGHDVLCRCVALAVIEL